MLNRSTRISLPNAIRTRSLAGQWLVAATLAISISIIAGCAPELGSDAWCQKMKETPKADWSANEAVDFAKHCILK
jgi:hypothetical protein